MGRKKIQISRILDQRNRQVGTNEAQLLHLTFEFNIALIVIFYMNTASVFHDWAY